MDDATRAWIDFDAELDAWAAAGRTATFWWRDDDAVAATPALDRLLAIAAGHAVPMGLAVIPATAEASLFARLARAPGIAVLQHGYAHRNHAPAGAKKCELGPERPGAMVLAELARGRIKLETASAGAALPVLVPPWNRIDDTVAARLGDAGLRGLSTSKPRASRQRPDGAILANVHVDPIDWPAQRRGEASFLGDAATLGAAIRHLRARRADSVDADEPTGFLTHHLVMDDATWRFAERLADAVARHGAARWIEPAAIFAEGGA